jgi:hypothetical protein
MLGRCDSSASRHRLFLMLLLLLFLSSLICCILRTCQPTPFAHPPRNIYIHAYTQSKFSSRALLSRRRFRTSATKGGLYVFNPVGKPDNRSIRRAKRCNVMFRTEATGTISLRARQVGNTGPLGATRWLESPEPPHNNSARMSHAICVWKRPLCWRRAIHQDGDCVRDYQDGNAVDLESFRVKMSNSYVIDNVCEVGDE